MFKTAVLSVLLTSCIGNVYDNMITYDTARLGGNDDWYESYQNDEVVYDNVGIDLHVGHLTSAGTFESDDPYLYLDPTGDWAFIQVVAFLTNVGSYNTDLIRVAFTSDRVEWICGQPSGSWIFLSQEECEAQGYYCDPVVAGEGISGYFDAGAGQDIAAVNAHCTAAGLPYTYTVEAYVYDISQPDPVVISHVAYADINCRAQQ